MKKAKKGHAVKQAKRMEPIRRREAEAKLKAQQDLKMKRKAKLERVLTDRKYRVREIKKVTQKAASKPHAIVGWTLDIVQADGNMRRGNVITAIKPRRGAATKHLIHYEDGTEDAIELARKDGHKGLLEKQKFELVQPIEELPEKRGVLWKRAIVSRKNWKKRFVVLDGWSKSLRYFKGQPEWTRKQEMPAPKGVFNLAARCTVKVYFDECEDNPDNKPFCFEVTSTETGRTLVLSAPNAGIMRSWVSKIQQCIEWHPGQEAERKQAAERRRVEQEAGLTDLPKAEKQLCAVAQKAIKALNDAMDTGESRIVDLVEDLLREACDVKPKITKLVEDLILTRPALSEAVIAINNELDGVIDRGHITLEGLGVDMAGDMKEADDDPAEDPAAAAGDGDSDDEDDDDSWSDDEDWD